MPSYHRLPGNPVSSLSYKDASKFIASSTLSPMCNNFAALSEIPNCAMCSSTQLSQHHEASWSSQRNRARSAASDMARNADVFPPDASTSNAKSTIAYSFTKKEKKKVSTTERERKRCKLKLSLLFLSPFLKMKRLFYMSDYGNGWRIFFRHSLRIPTSTNAVIVTVAKKAFLHRGAKRRERQKRHKLRINAKEL